MSDSSDRQAAPEPQEPQPELTIASVEGLFSALRSSELRVRLSVLVAISKAPAKALSYGRWDGRDLIDEMLAQLETAVDGTYRMTLLGTLASYDDRRVTDAFQRTFRAPKKAAEAAICASYLSSDDPDAVRTFFLPFLDGSSRTAQARLAADALGRLGGLSPEMSVRVAVLSGEALQVPPLDAQTEATWWDALRGPSQVRAMALIESLGPAAFARLCEKWSELTTPVKVWMLRWGAKFQPEGFAELLQSALAEDLDETTLAALNAIADRPDLGEAVRAAVTRLVVHSDPKLRAAALRAGGEVADVRSSLASESELEVRLLLIRRLVPALGAAALTDLIALLQDRRWQVRSAATTELTSLGAAAADAVQPLLDHDDVGVRAAAVQVLEGLGGATTP